MSYARGDIVVHPHHGAAVVTGVVERDLGAGPVQYLELHIDKGSLTISVPADLVAAAGIRDVSTRAEAEDILALLSDDAVVPERWTERHAVTAARLRSTDLCDLALVVRDLTRHAERTGKPLSSNEKASLDNCLGLLARELALSLGLPEQDVRTLILERAAGASSLA